MHSRLACHDRAVTEDSAKPPVVPSVEADHIHRDHLRKEGWTIALYVAICLIAALTALEPLGIDLPMAVKRGRFGQFLACTGFPECRNAKSLQVKIGVACPECGATARRVVGSFSQPGRAKKVARDRLDRGSDGPGDTDGDEAAPLPEHSRLTAEPADSAARAG